MGIEERLKQEALKKKVKKPEEVGMAMEPTPMQNASAGEPSAPQVVNNAPIDITAEKAAYPKEDLFESTQIDPERKVIQDDGEPSKFMEENKDWMIAGATPLLVGLLMGNAGDAFDVASKGILDIEQRKYDEDVKKQSFARKLALASSKKKDAGLVKTMGPDGKPVFTRREDAIGKEAYEKAAKGFNLEEKMILEKWKSDLKGKEGIGDGALITEKQLNSKIKLYNAWKTDGVTKDSKNIASSWAKIRSAKNSPAGNMGMIFNFMRMLDPSSVVRESEFRAAGKAGALPERVQNWYDMVVNKKLLGPEQRKDFLSTAKEIYMNQMKQQRNVNATAIQFAKEAGLPNPSNVVTDFTKGMGLEKDLKPTIDTLPEGTIVTQKGKKFIIKGGKPVPYKGK